MKKYIQVQFQNVTSLQTEMLIALLSEQSFAGFQEEPGILNAYIEEEDFDEFAVTEISNSVQTTFEKKYIEETNWNELWESNYSPVLIDDFVVIRAAFHQPYIGIKHEIIITPKMSFGTGHHATTTMMIRLMKDLNFQNKDVLDFGTGTGILSILAKKMGASKVLAIDYDDWSIENAKENFEKNNCDSIELQKADTVEQLSETFDIILANINKNVILDNLSFFADKLNKGGILLISGFLIADETNMETAAVSFSLKITRYSKEKNWMALQLAN
jgi:ribosomal protein L11 methyltransferase